MKTIQAFLLFILLFTVNTYPQDTFTLGVEVKTVEIPTSSTNPEGLTTENLTKEYIPTTANLDTNSILQAKETVTISKEIISTSDASTSPVDFNPTSAVDRILATTESTHTTAELQDTTWSPPEPLNDLTTGSAVSPFECCGDSITSSTKDASNDLSGKPLITANDEEQQIDSESTSQTTMDPLEGIGLAVVQNKTSGTKSSSPTEEIELTRESKPTTEVSRKLGPEFEGDITTKESAAESEVSTGFEAEVTKELGAVSDKVTEYGVTSATILPDSSETSKTPEAAKAPELFGPTKSTAESLSTTGTDASEEPTTATSPETSKAPELIGPSENTAESVPTTGSDASEEPETATAPETSKAPELIGTLESIAESLPTTGTDASEEPTTATSPETSKAPELIGPSESTVESVPTTGSDASEEPETATAPETSKAPELIGIFESIAESLPTTGTGASEEATTATAPETSKAPESTAESVPTTGSDASEEPETATVPETSKAPELIGLSVSTAESLPTTGTNESEPPVAPDASQAPDLIGPSESPSASDVSDAHTTAAEPDTSNAPKASIASTQATETDETTSTASEPTETIVLNQVPKNPTTSTPPSEASPCTEAGNFLNPTNCHSYIACSGNVTDRSRQEIECPARSAFSPVLRRCSRDISPCAGNDVTCLKAGSLPDPDDTSSYYWCVRNLLGGYHKYHIQCSANEVFNALIGRCFPELPIIQLNGLPSDRDVVRAEWKQLKREIKVKVKAQKIRQKMEAKAKAVAAKLAAKAQKKQKADDDD